MAQDSKAPNYAILFNPSQNETTAPHKGARGAGDLNDGLAYVFTGQSVMAVRVALATGRPLLVRGEPGSGKSSLAPRVARALGWRLYTQVVTSRTQARDLLWTVDAVRRLSDAQNPNEKVGEEFRYRDPGVLWWAIHPVTAAQRGAPKETPLDAKDEAHDPRDPEIGGSPDTPAVILIDEIDKAEPDFPNDLLVPLGTYRFPVPGLEEPIKAAVPPLVIITSNGERELPLAFRRRCIDLKLPEPNSARLIEVATKHFGPKDDKLFKRIADATMQVRDEHKSKRLRPPSIAEFLDAILAFRQLHELQQLDGAIMDDQALLDDIERLTLRKTGEAPPLSKT